MKYIISLLIILAFNISQAQDIESLNARILKLETQQKEIQLNLDRSHKQFSTGTVFLISGFTVSALGALLYDRGLENGAMDDPGRGKFNPAFLIIGGGLMTVGTVIQIDAHKWIGRAGRKKK